MTRAVQAHRQAGFSLIEVLVAVLVLTVGLLGVAAMQMVSFQNNQGAYFRTQATYIAAEILDRMRANDPDGYATYTGTYNDTWTAPADPGCATTAAGCTPVQTANMDLRQWGMHFSDVFAATDYRPTIPGGSAVVALDGGTTYTVTVSWNEASWDDTADADGSLQRSNLAQQVTLTATLQ